MTEAVNDQGATIPECKRTLALQVQQLMAGLRPAMLFPRTVDGIDRSVPLPNRMGSVTTDDGLFYFDPALISTADIVKAAELGTLNTVLMMGPYSKADIAGRVIAGELPLAVTECDPNGVEVKTAWGTHMTAPVQVEAMEASKTPGHDVFITSPAHIVMLRLIGNALEKTPLAFMAAAPVPHSPCDASSAAAAMMEAA